MTDARYFVVRGSPKRRRFAIETGLQRSTEHQLRKPREHGEAIIYMCEIPDALSLKEAISLYLNGVKVKPKALTAERKTLAAVLEDKRVRRERAKREGNRTA